MKRNGTLLIAIMAISIVFVACSKDDEYSIPSIKTSNAEVFSNGGVKLKGNIINLGSEKVVDYGFVTGGVRYHGELPARKGSFSTEIRQGLYPDREYFFTAYIKTETETYWGEELQFISNGSAAPVLEKCLPSMTHINDTIILQGSNFPENNVNRTQLKYGNSYAKILSISETEIEFVVPIPTDNNNVIQITAFDRTTQKADILSLFKPEIIAINPITAFFGDTITIEGDHLANIEYNTKVKIGPYNAEIVSTSRMMTKVIIPENAQYSNSKIELTAQNQTINYNFNLKVPKFTYVPDMVYTGGTIDVKVDQTSSIKRKFLINERESYPSVIDDTTYRFSLYNSVPYDNRQVDLVWRINDLDVVSDVPLNIVNPFIKIKEGIYDFWTFSEFDKVFTIDDKVYVMGNRRSVYTDARRFMYRFDDINRKWIEHSFIDTNKNSDIQAFGPYPSSLTPIFSKHDEKIYVLHQSQYANNFFKIDIDSGDITTLPSNHASQYYGVGFAYGNKVYYTAHTGDDVWQYDVAANSWNQVTNTPFIKGGTRNFNVNVIVVDNYAYFANGAEGTNYADFWRLNLDNLQWEQLPDNPNPQKYSTVYHFNDELHFVTGEANKYNLNTGIWEPIENSGVSSGLNEPITSFIQNGVPYLIRKNVFTNVTHLNLYIGDLIE